MNLRVLDSELSVCKISSPVEIPFQDEFVFVGKTNEELSLVCNTKSVPKTSITREDGWRGFRVEEGKLAFPLIGIIAKISGILAENNISVFVISTFNTDYVLIKADQLERASGLLEENDYRFVGAAYRLSDSPLIYISDPVDTKDENNGM